MSMWLSTANSHAGAMRAQATAQAKKQVNHAGLCVVAVVGDHRFSLCVGQGHMCPREVVRLVLTQVGILGGGAQRFLTRVLLLVRTKKSSGLVWIQDTKTLSSGCSSNASTVA